jgi:catechol 2,3-dioxygenase-like lactoylglutathione lyase family enzyme
MARHVGGIDHVVILVRDLDEACRRYERLGFTLSPRGLHSAHMGTGNHTLMLDTDYFELLGVVAPTERNAHYRQALTVREGLTSVALRIDDAAAAQAELRAAGIEAEPPVHFSRPVDLPDGRRTEAAFDTIELPRARTPLMRMFGCQHHTRDAVWLPELMGHPNTACALSRVVVLAKDPAGAGAGHGRIFATTPQTAHDGVVTVPTGNTPLVFATRERAVTRWPGAGYGDLPEEGLAAIGFTVRDLDACRAALEAGGVRSLALGGSLFVAPAEACGTLLEFSASAG